MISPLLEVRNLSKHQQAARRAERSIFQNVTFAIDHCSFSVLTGPSGAGKSTLLRCLCSLEHCDGGEVRFEGLPICFRKRERRAAPVQLIFQDPGASLNPRFTAHEIVEEPLRILASGTRETRRKVVAELFELTGLPEASRNRRAWQFSGGQRTRLAIARALAAEPKLLLLDESLSGLDVSVRGQILNLLLDLQHWRGLSYLLVTHDNGLANALAEKILILENGRLVTKQHAPVEFDAASEMAFTT